MSSTDALGSLAPYLRVSSAEQKHQGTIDNQRAAAERYLAGSSSAPYSWYADDGVSGTIPFAQRPEKAHGSSRMCSPGASKPC
jgi:DNA invertase Pin-like site-specific DNA recombinase